jgi:BirA family biotin operon repressor/biotin-[acetyl-CoA-carboxylase] ligase
VTDGTLTYQITTLASVGSTNDEAKRLAQEGAPEGTVVVATVQTAGRGRRGKVWASPAGNLFLSVVLRPPIAPSGAPPLSPALGLAVALAIEEVAPLAAELKWPNDVMVGGRKVAGILTESVVLGGKLVAVIAGFGINVGAELPPELSGIGTTLSREAGRNVRKEEIQDALLASIAGIYRRFLGTGFASIRSEWEDRDRLNGRTVAIDAGTRTVRGIARGISDDGALRIETSQGVIELTTGEVL